MASPTLTDLRLAAHRLGGAACADAARAAAWQGAMQAQDFASARLAVALRAEGGTEAAVQEALRDRAIVRTWAMRGTLQLVAAEDAHWIAALVGPAAAARAAPLNRTLDLDERTFPPILDKLQKILAGTGGLTRAEVFGQLNGHGIATAGQRGSHILNGAAFAGLLCHGVQQGKQDTYVLLDEWVPCLAPLDKEAALAELAWRYLRSHGPASAEDFAFWSGLGLTAARAGIAMNGALLESMKADGSELWFAAGSDAPKTPRALLLPAFDEYLLGYRDRGAVLNARHAPAVLTVNGLFRAVMVLEGRVAGTWRRVSGKGRTTIVLEPFDPLTKTQRTAFAEAAAVWPGILASPVDIA